MFREEQRDSAPCGPCLLSAAQYPHSESDKPNWIGLDWIGVAMKRIVFDWNEIVKRTENRFLSSEYQCNAG